MTAEILVVATQIAFVVWVVETMPYSIGYGIVPKHVKDRKEGKFFGHCYTNDCVGSTFKEFRPCWDATCRLNDKLADQGSNAEVALVNLYWEPPLHRLWRKLRR